MTRKGQQKVLEGQERVDIRLSSSFCAMGGGGTSLFPSVLFFHFGFILPLTISRDKEILRGVTLDKT